MNWRMKLNIAVGVTDKAMQEWRLIGHDEAEFLRIFVPVYTQTILAHLYDLQVETGFLLRPPPGRSAVRPPTSEFYQVVVGFKHGPFAGCVVLANSEFDYTEALQKRAEGAAAAVSQVILKYTGIA